MGKMKPDALIVNLKCWTSNYPSLPYFTDIFKMWW